MKHRADVRRLTITVQELHLLPYRLRVARQARGLSIRAAAAELDMSHANLSKIERGLTQPGLDHVVRILTWLGAHTPAAAVTEPPRPQRQRWLLNVLARFEQFGQTWLAAESPQVYGLCVPHTNGTVPLNRIAGLMHKTVHGLANDHLVVIGALTQLPHVNTPHGYRVRAGHTITTTRGGHQVVAGYLDSPEATP